MIAMVKVNHAASPIWQKRLFYKQNSSSRHQSSIPAFLKFRWYPWSYVVYPFKVAISTATTQGFLDSNIRLP
jgi:uncharacterized membrane protein